MIDRITGVRYQYHVARVDKGQGQMTDALFRTDERHDFRNRVERDPEAPLIPLRHRFTKLQRAFVGWILMIDGVFCRGLQGPNDMRRVGISGSPIPRLMRSTPWRRISSLTLSISANKYGGRPCRRLANSRVIKGFSSGHDGGEALRSAGTK